MKKGFAKDFTTLTLVLIPVAIAINIAIGQLVYAVKLPLYLDSVGTVLVGLVAGPWAGALTGLLSNLVWGMSGLAPTYTPFAAVAAVIGMLAGLFGESGWFKTWWKVIVGGLITGLIAAVISAPISAYVFGGVTGSGTDLVVAFFRNMGAGILPATFAQGVSSDPLDKMITFLVVWGIVLALPKRFLARFPRAENVTEGESAE
jgi:energy-coupling factor transport system substrate-specific component